MRAFAPMADMTAHRSNSAKGHWRALPQRFSARTVVHAALPSKKSAYIISIVAYEIELDTSPINAGFMSALGH
jgi:hypothetical protein